MSKNICLIIDTLGGNMAGGTVMSTLSLAQGLSNLDCKVSVIVLDEGASCFLLDEFNFDIHTIKQIKHPIKFIRAAKQSKLLKQKISNAGINFDLFISNSTYDATVCKKAKLNNVYYVARNALGTQHIQGSSFIGFKQQIKCSYRNIFKFFIRKFLYKSFIKGLYNNENLITVSKGVEQDILEFGIQPKTIQTIYNPFDFKDIEQQSNEYLVKEEDYIVHVGGLTLVKQHNILIHAYKQSGIKQKLLLLGDDTAENGKQIKQLIIDLDLQNQITLKGFISNPFPYIKNAKALVLSSEQEGFGRVLVEALILGTPVISTNCIAGPSEILVDEFKPFLSPVGDIQALAKNIIRMIDNPVEITDKYTDKFSSEVSAKQYLSLCS
jgi:glycosyltransferase involved in cell wall biosynthesis